MPLPTFARWTMTIKEWIEYLSKYDTENHKFRLILKKLDLDYGYDLMGDAEELAKAFKALKQLEAA